MQIQMIGHSTLLIQARGLRILTDPFFGTGGNNLFERIAPPAAAREALADVQLVLLSHTHWDHVDPAYFTLLPSSVPVVMPKFAARSAGKLRIKNAVGLSWWEGRAFGDATVTAVPAIHDAIAAGFVIEVDGRRLYFSGDTYYAPFMKRIGRDWSLDVALLPVTTARIPLAMGPAAAVRATKDLAPAVVIPIHLGLRPRPALVRSADTPGEFERRAHEARLQSTVIHLKDGGTFNLD